MSTLYSRDVGSVGYETRSWPHISEEGWAENAGSPQQLISSDMVTSMHITIRCGDGGVSPVRVCQIASCHMSPLVLGPSLMLVGEINLVQREKPKRNLRCKRRKGRSQSQKCQRSPTGAQSARGAFSWRTPSSARSHPSELKLNLNSER